MSNFFFNGLFVPIILENLQERNEALHCFLFFVFFHMGESLFPGGIYYKVGAEGMH